MDFFKFNPGTSPTLLEDGEFISNIDRATWIERYSAPGEFSFTGFMSSGLSEFLPAGTLISHVDTAEVMIVENHEVVENKEDDPQVTITGRSFVSYLENRIVGTALARASSTISAYTLAADDIWDQIVTMINAHVKAGVAAADDALTDVQATTALGSGGTSDQRDIDKVPVLNAVLDLLKIEDMGIRTVRKGFNAGSPSGTEFQVFKGTDRTDTVRFSWLEGDLEAANYLLSIKNSKNSAMVVGQYVVVIVDLGPTKYDRRMMVVDGKDIDGHIGQMPSGSTTPTLVQVTDAMEIRGLQALFSQNPVTISQTDISDNTRYRYRRDYDIGDLVTLDANYNQSLIMRVVEYAEIEDENGESGHPTLAVPL